MTTPSSIQKVQVKLGSSKSRGFYSMDIDKPYTEIQANKMPYNVLSILQSDIISREIGVTELTLSDKLLRIQPDLAVDQYGYSSTLPILLKDFIAADLVFKDRNKYRITSLGIEFFKSNIMD